MAPRPGAPGRWRSGAVVVVTLALGLLLFAASGSAWREGRSREAAERSYVHTLDVLLLTGELKVAVLSALRGERGYLLTDNPAFLRPYEEGRAAMPVRLAELRHLTRDDPYQQRATAMLARQVDSYRRLLHRTIALERAGSGAAALAIVRAGAGKYAVDAILGTLDRMEARERGALVARRALAERSARSNERLQYALSAIGALLLLLGAAAAIAARRSHLAAMAATAELRRLAATDELTGIANRRAFLDGLTRELARRDREGRPLSLAIIDLDHFKRVNDRHGHPAGDEVIRSVARRAAGAIRGSDLVGRLGGEEFAVLMPGVDEAGAVGACERLRAAVQRAPVDVAPGVAVAVTLSIGVATARDGETAADLTARADRTLYHAKQCGRDRVLLAA